VVLRNGVSTWLPVTSGVPQGSILGPVLFLLYVNDLPDAMENTAKMFADDTKLYSSIVSREDCVSLQDDLNSLSTWSRTWLLNFNESKCVVLRIKAAISFFYSMNGVYLNEVTDQKDLGVLISNDLKPSKHINTIVKKSYQKLGMFRRCFSGFTQEKVIILYTSIIRPTLEYASIVWSPWLKKDVQKLEKVQKRCLRLCNEEIKLEPLESRRHFTDMVETYKYLNGFYKTESALLFEHPTRQLRGHAFKLHKCSFKSDIAKHFFTNRVFEDWNRLPANVVEAPTLSEFKRRLRSLPTGEER
jgi:hypothetical protein